VVYCWGSRSFSSPRPSSSCHLDGFAFVLVLFGPVTFTCKSCLVVLGGLQAHFSVKLWGSYPVKSVGAQDRRTTTTKLVALAGNGAGVFAQALYGGEREEDERGREIRDN